MDGLRGFLALSVVFHHASIYHGYLRYGVWGSPPSGVFSHLGPFGVNLFFMITGFLFWSQMLRAGGRPAWLRLYVGRVFRIGPLFLAAALVVLACVAWSTGPHLQESVPRLLVHIARWLSLGMLSTASVNAFPGTFLVLVGVTWTLHFEWLFYLSLPVLALFARGRRMHLPFAVGALVLAQLLLPHVHSALGVGMYLARIFLLGMISASLYREGWTWKVPDWLLSALMLGCVGVYFCFSGVPLLPLLALGVLFYLLVSGGSLFGLLRSRPARRLGDVSYGIYLLQGIALGLVFRLPGLRVYDLASPAAHWLMTFAAGAVLIALATASHVWIELPGIAAGKRVVAALARRRAPQP